MPHMGIALFFRHVLKPDVSATPYFRERNKQKHLMGFLKLNDMSLFIDGRVWDRTGQCFGGHHVPWYQTQRSTTKVYSATE